MGSILKEWQEKWAADKGEWPNVIPINLNVGIQIYDRGNNEVLMYLDDSDSPGPHRTVDVLIQAERLVEFYNLHPRPFKVNDSAILKPGQVGLQEPVRVRIIECKASSHCGSGWLVMASRWRRGRRPRFPSILVRNLDSDWFEKYEETKAASATNTGHQANG